MSKVHATLTSSDGCSVTVDGNADVSYDRKNKYWIVVKFTGTVTLGGGSGCPKGTMTFKHKGSNDKPGSDKELTAKVHGKNLRDVSKITWRGGDSRVNELLNHSGLNEDLCKQLRSATEAAEVPARVAKGKPT